MVLKRCAAAHLYAQEVARYAVNIMKVYFNKKFWEELLPHIP
jgi:hypothetical protein